MRLQDIRGIGTRGKSLELKIERFRLEFGKEFFPVREAIPDWIRHKIYGFILKKGKILRR